MREEELQAALWEVVRRVVETEGVAHCYDRYCHDDEWSYCIFCEEGDTDPHKLNGEWKHTPDCIVTKARVLTEKGILA